MGVARWCCERAFVFECARRLESVLGEAPELIRDHQLYIGWGSPACGASLFWCFWGDVCIPAWQADNTCAYVQSCMQALPYTAFWYRRQLSAWTTGPCYSQRVCLGNAWKKNLRVPITSWRCSILVESLAEGVYRRISPKNCWRISSACLIQSLPLVTIGWDMVVYAW